MKNIVIFLSALLILTSCSMGSGDKSPKTMDTPVYIGSGTTYTQDIADASTRIRETPEFQGCMKQQATMCIQTTGMQIAQKSKDATFCQELSNGDQRSSCEFAITMVNAREKNDVKLCDSIANANYKAQCKNELYRQEAVSKNDITLCNKISSSETPASGNTMPGMMPGMMQGNEQKNQCMMQVIMSASGSTRSDCTQLSDTGAVTMCEMMMKNKQQMIYPAPIGIPK